MGCFSWMYADNTEENIKICGDSFTLLFPDGRKWTDTHYDGYGHITNPVIKKQVDVYALLACWNRKLIVEKIDLSVAFDYAFSGMLESIKNDFYNLEIDDSYFVKKVQEGDYEFTETLRIAGITLQFNDVVKRDESFKPLKFVEDARLSYDDVDESLDDPNQGADMSWDDEEDYIGQCDYCGCDIYSDDDYIDDVDGLFCSCGCQDSHRENEEEENMYD